MGARERTLVLNESAAVALSWAPGDAVGRSLRVVEPRNEDNNPGLAGVIVGVVQDFHQGSARVPISAAVYHPARSLDVPGLHVMSHVLVRLAPPGTAGAEHVDQQLDRLKAAWRTVLPSHPFEAAFFSDRVTAQYESDRRLDRAVGLFAGFAVLVSLLGLFGLASFFVQRRTKEIGIRKVLGASVRGIVLLVSKEFTLLVVLSAVLAAPVAYLAMERWLEDFAYRVPLSGWVFLFAGLSTLLLALVAVGYHAGRSAIHERPAPEFALRVSGRRGGTCERRNRRGTIARTTAERCGGAVRRAG